MALDQCLANCPTANATASCYEACFTDAGWTAPVQAVLPVPVAIAIAGVLVCCSGLFSGLTLGVLSLDLVGLRILEKGGEEWERVYARKIMPVRAKGNLLLCTLLFGNTVVNAGIAILLSSLTSGVFGLVISTFIILLLGEIIPQAACSRHGLRVGAFVVPLVRVFIVLFLPITFVIAYCLDKVLGRDIGTVYSQEELKRLIDIHLEDPDAQKESGLTASDHRLLIGAFEYKNKTVADVMTKLQDCFMLERSAKLNFETLSKIYISGCSRIPIYERDQHNIVGVLYAKDLILVDAEDELEISAVLAFRSRGPVARIPETAKLDKVFAKFMAGSQHMLIAHRAPAEGATSRPSTDELAPGGGAESLASQPVTGLITLEDVLEEIIKSEIYDEADEDEKQMLAAKKGQTRGIQRGEGADNHRQDVSMFLKLFDPRLKGARLSVQEVQAVYSFLALNVPEFAPLTNSDLAFMGLIRTAQVLEKGADGEQGSPRPQEAISGDQFWEQASAAGQLLYQRKKVSQHFTLILQGKVMVRTGSEGFELEQGAWNTLGVKALHMEPYVADFDAMPVAPYRILRITKGAYVAALDAVRVQQVSEYQAVKSHVRAGGLQLPSAGAGAGEPGRRASFSGLGSSALGGSMAAAAVDPKMAAVAAATRGTGSASTPSPSMPNLQQLAEAAAAGASSGGAPPNEPLKTTSLPPPAPPPAASESSANRKGFNPQTLAELVPWQYRATQSALNRSASDRQMGEGSAVVAAAAAGPNRVLATVPSEHVREGQEAQAGEVAITIPPGASKPPGSS